MMSGRFVAPITKTFFFELTPSISVSSWLITRSAAPPPSPELPPRWPAIESSSSKKSTHRAARLLEDVAHVRLRLAEPHGEQLGPLDRDEVRLALVRDRLRHERLAAAGRAVEEHAARGRHAELLELLGVLDGVLHELAQLALDVGEAADVLPRRVRHLDDGLARDRLGVDVVVELHVARVDAEDLEAAVLVGHADVDLAVEAAEAAERGVDGVGPVRRDNHDDRRALLEAV